LCPCCVAGELKGTLRQNKTKENNIQLPTAKTFPSVDSRLFVACCFFLVAEACSFFIPLISLGAAEGRDLTLEGIRRSQVRERQYLPRPTSLCYWPGGLSLLTALPAFFFPSGSSLPTAHSPRRVKRNPLQSLLLPHPHANRDTPPSPTPPKGLG
jgi:hypothetical protein